MYMKLSKSIIELQFQGPLVLEKDEKFHLGIFSASDFVN